MAFEQCRFCNAEIGDAYDAFRHSCPGKEAWVRNELEPQLAAEKIEREAAREAFLARAEAAGIPEVLLSQTRRSYSIDEEVIAFLDRLEQLNTLHPLEEKG